MGFRTIHITAGINCGKTLSAVSTVKMLLKTNPQFKTVLIAAPEGIPDVFKAELMAELDGHVKITIVGNKEQIPVRSRYDVVVDDLFSSLTRYPLLNHIANEGYLIETHILSLNKTRRDAMYDGGEEVIYKVGALKNGIQLRGRYNSTKHVIVDLKSDARTITVSISDFPITPDGVKAALRRGLANQRRAGTVALDERAFNRIVAAASYNEIPSPEIMELVRRHIGVSDDNDVVIHRVLDAIGLENWLPEPDVLEQINVAITEVRKAR